MRSGMPFLGCTCCFPEPVGHKSANALGARSVYDNEELSMNWGAIQSGWVKKLYRGVRVDGEAALNGLTSIELSLDGVSPNLDVFSWNFPDADIVLGTDIRTPDDTVNGQGGINVAWRDCIVTNRVLSGSSSRRASDTT